MKIVQFKNSNNEDILPLAYNVGGTKIDLLWTNPSPTSTFAEQTISLDLSNYSIIYITFNFSNSINNKVSSNCLLNSGNCCVAKFYNDANEYNRFFSSTTSGVSFLNASRYSDTSSTKNEFLIPYQIYGIKTSYVVPTEVQGLQYVEVQ